MKQSHIEITKNLKESSEQLSRVLMNEIDRQLTRSWTSNAEIAKDLNMSRSQLDRYAKGTSQPSADKLLRMMMYFKIGLEIGPKAAIVRSVGY